MTLLHTFLSLTNFRSPFLRTLLPSIAAAYAIQAAVAVPSILAGSERFYDFSGSLTYISCIALSLYLPTLRARAAAELAGKTLPQWPSLVASLTAGGGINTWNWRQIVLSAAVMIWATRRRIGPTCVLWPEPHANSLQVGSFLVSRVRPATSLSPLAQQN